MTAPDTELVLRRLLGPGRPEVGCDECFDLLDRYVEAEIAQAPFAPCPRCLAPAECGPRQHCLGMQAHLEGCPACADEYRSLLALLRSSG
jgi:hypothetical protein